jgi:integrase
VLVAAFSGLRWGELAALRRCDVDLSTGSVRVPRKLAKLRDRMEFGPPKSEAGKRTVTLPTAALAVLRPHLLAYVDPEPEALIFTGAKGAMLRSSNFHGATKWVQDVAKVGLPTGFTSMTCATPATRWRRPRARARGS